MYDDDEKERTIPHAFLVRANGRPLKFLRMTEDPCPVCGRGPKPAKLAVLQDHSGTETVCCIQCDHQEIRPAKNPKQRPMNSGG